MLIQTAHPRWLPATEVRRAIIRYFGTEVLRSTVFEITPAGQLTTLRRVVAHYGADFDTFPGPRENRVTVTITPHHIVAHG